MKSRERYHGLTKAGFALAGVLTVGALVDKVVDPLDRYESMQIEGASGEVGVATLDTKPRESTQNEHLTDAVYIIGEMVAGAMALGGAALNNRRPRLYVVKD